MPRTDENVVDMIGFREFEERIRRIDRLKDVRGEPVTFEVQGLGPVLQCDQTIDPLVVALFVERRIKGNPPQLEHIKASKSGGRQCRQNAFRRDAERIVQRRRSLRQVNGDRDDRRRRDLRRRSPAARSIW